MARIRTIKPDFFRHEALYEAERESGLPLRLAFAGLWTAADREGRFVWSPRQLKLDCLPYDDIDFARVLDALRTRGFIVNYEVGGKQFGAIPGWHRHQVINNRETASTIPAPNDVNDLTRAARVGDATGTPLVRDQGEGKGREAGRERKGEGDARARALPANGEVTPMTIDFALSDDDSAFARALGMTDATVNAELSKFIARKMSRKEVSADWSADWRMWCHRWTERKPGNADPPAAGGAKMDYDGALKLFVKTGIWSKHAPCGEPGQSTCTVPAELFAKYGLLPDGRKIESKAGTV